MPRNLDVGTMVADKYKLVERLGGGGMGDVYRAEHVLAGRTVALKLLRPDFADNEDLTRRFFFEAQAVNKIRHPNIVDVLDAGLSGHGPYVVMECLEGASLADALHMLGNIDVPAALSVVVPMLSALDAAHRSGIVHRDLKPENVFLAEQGGEVRVKLLDFGIAKVLDSHFEASPRTSTGVIFGTPDYLSPEQANGEGDVDGRSDIFSVGTVLFELITGRRPFEAPTAVATAYKIVHAPAPTLLTMGFGVEPALQHALDTALAKDRADRFATAADFADALAAVTPHGVERRQALAALLASVVAQASTRAPSRRGRPSFEPSLPIVVPLERQPTPVPAAPKAPAPPVAPTLVSPSYAGTPQAPRAMPVREVSAPPPAREPSYPSAPPLSFSNRPAALDSRAPPASGRASSPGPLSPRVSSSRPGAWTPRPLPASARGRCHVRGTLPRAVGRWIVRAHGDRGRDAVLASLPPDLADIARTDAFNALVWYDLEMVDTFIEAATHIVQAGDPRSWRPLARDNFERDLGPIFRPGTRSADAGALLRRLPTVWGRIFDFGAVRASDIAPRRMSVRVDGFDAASLAIRNMVLGTFEGMLAPVPGATIRMLAGEASFAREFEIECAW